MEADAKDKSSVYLIELMAINWDHLKKEIAPNFL